MASFDVFPIPATSIISTLFGQLDSTHSHPHGGVDFAVGVGTPCWCPADGTVSSIFSDSGGGGNVLEVEHDNGLTTVYMHLSSYNTKVGQRVAAGDVLAFSGGAKGAPGAGDSTGPHLHFEVHDSDDNKLNPLDFLPGTWSLSNNLAKLVGKDTIEGGSTSLLMIVGGGAIAFLLWKILTDKGII